MTSKDPLAIDCIEGDQSINFKFMPTLPTTIEIYFDDYDWGYAAKPMKEFSPIDFEKNKAESAEKSKQSSISVLWYELLSGGTTSFIYRPLMSSGNE